MYWHEPEGGILRLALFFLNRYILQYCCNDLFDAGKFCVIRLFKNDDIVMNKGFLPSTGNYQSNKSNTEKKISACRKKLAHPNHQSNSNSLVHDIHVPLSATAGITHTTPATPRRYLAYLAAFSRKHTMKQVYEFLSTRLRINREDLRIWKFKDEVCVLEYLYIFFRTNEGTARSVLWNSWSLNF